MNDGGGESEKQFEESIVARKKSGPDAFAQAIAKVAVAQVCESVGFQSFQQLALNTLSDVAIRYISSIGKTANLYANLAGRTDCNVFDIIQGLEDLGSQQGFMGASDINHCLAESGTVQEITQYIGECEEIPFAYSIPNFPVVKDRNPSLSFAQIAGMSPAEHIPAWLPAFPEPQAYIELDTQTDEIEAAKECKKVKQSKMVLQQQLACTKGQPSGNSNNPFLVAPLLFGEKEVSLVALPDKLSSESVEGNRPFIENHVSAVDTFAPAIEAMKSRLSDSEECQNKTLSDKRPTVKFKLGIGKKSLVTQMSARNEGNEKSAFWFGNEYEKDDKKRRAEQILKESMENPHELAQL